MEITLYRRTKNGWQRFNTGDMTSVGTILDRLKSERGVVRVTVGKREFYRTAEDVSTWTEATHGRGNVKQVDEAGFKAALEGWDDNEGPMLEALENVFEDKLRVNSVNLSKDAGGG
jgi:hypothetical protein